MRNITASILNSLSTSCVAYYKMDDNAASTVVIDSKGRSNGTATSDTSDLHEAGKIGGALRMPGDTNYITLNDNFSDIIKGGFSISFWIRPVLPTNQNGWELGCTDKLAQGSQLIFYYFIDGSTPTIFYILELSGEENHSVVYIPNFTSDEWYHVVLTGEQNGENVSIKIYINNALVGSDSAAGDLASNYINTVDMTIGIAGANVNWNAAFDEFAIFNKAVSEDEIDALYNEGAGAILP